MSVCSPALADGGTGIVWACWLAKPARPRSSAMINGNKNDPGEQDKPSTEGHTACFLLHAESRLLGLLHDLEIPHLNFIQKDQQKNLEGTVVRPHPLPHHSMQTRSPTLSPNKNGLSTANH